MPSSPDAPSGPGGVRILIIGSEVTQGFIFDTNTQFFCAELFNIGVEVRQILVIPDNKSAILAAINEFLTTGDFILTTGGLGPTDDDLTVDVLCELFQTSAVFVKDCEKRVNVILRKMKNRASEKISQARFEKRLHRQCRIPEIAEALPNNAGLAPGIYIQKHRIISLPGFPLEIRDIWPGALKKISENIKPAFLSKTFNIWGVMESILYETLQSPENQQKEIVMGNHALPWGNQLFLRAPVENKTSFMKLAGLIETQFAANILENPVQTWVDFLLANKVKFGTVESCTGGYAAKLITDIPGVSAVFPGSIVSYDNLIKTNLAGVSEKTLESFGAVSRETAVEMAIGGSNSLGSDITISITGIAGPGGGSREKPVGTVFFGIYNRKENHIYSGQGYFPSGRERFRNAAVYFIFLSLYQRYVYYRDEAAWLNSFSGKNFQKESRNFP